VTAQFVNAEITVRGKNNLTRTHRVKRVQNLHRDVTVNPAEYNDGRLLETAFQLVGGHVGDLLGRANRKLQFGVRELEFPGRRHHFLRIRGALDTKDVDERRQHE